jgi:hypothetical protein
MKIQVKQIKPHCNPKAALKFIQLPLKLEIIPSIRTAHPHARILQRRCNNVWTTTLSLPSITLDSLKLLPNVTTNISFEQGKQDELAASYSLLQSVTP